MKRKISILLAILLVFTMIPSTAFAGGLTKSSIGSPVKITELVSNNSRLEHNYVKITCDTGVLKIEGETPIYSVKYGINIKKLKKNSAGKQEITWRGNANVTDMGDYYAFNYDLDTTDLSGDYILVMTLSQEKKTEGGSPVFYKNCCFRVTDGSPKILEYGKIKTKNANVRKASNKIARSKFKNKKLADICSLFHMKTTDSKKAYFKKVADDVTKGAVDNYDKALKIYEYVGTNFYYDNYAFKKGKNQYTDPYKNLYNLRNNKASANSVRTTDGSGMAKVATTCVGYAAMVVALARAEDIPARIINGHHLSLGGNNYCNWTTEEDVTSVDHWWAELYVDGRWIVVDATPANSNKWERSSFEDKGTWEYTGLTNYVYFDPTNAQFAQNHEAFELKGNY